MKLVELTEFLVKSIAKQPDMVSVKQFEDEEDIVNIQVFVSEEDMGSVIGKGGSIANSIRTIVQAASYIGDNKKVKINIDSF
ncbi:MAG TPA: KH domain-containing protein [Tenericutes bacterium]|nr:KH domain-containing protein [Mycoplasmatota bacterium]